MVSELFHNTVNQAHKLQNLQFDLLFKQLAAGVNFNSKVSELKTTVKKVLFFLFFSGIKEICPFWTSDPPSS